MHETDKGVRRKRSGLLQKKMTDSPFGALKQDRKAQKEKEEKEYVKENSQKQH